MWCAFVWCCHYTQLEAHTVCACFWQRFFLCSRSLSTVPDFLVMYCICICVWLCIHTVFLICCNWCGISTNTLSEIRDSFPFSTLLAHVPNILRCVHSTIANLLVISLNSHNNYCTTAFYCCILSECVTVQYSVLHYRYRVIFCPWLLPDLNFRLDLLKMIDYVSVKVVRHSNFRFVYFWSSWSRWNLILHLIRSTGRSYISH